MKHYYKLTLPNNNFDIFFSSLDTTKKTVTFMAATKEGKILPNPETNKKESTMNYLLENDMFTVLGLLQVSSNFFFEMNNVLNGSDELKQNAV